MTVLSTDPPYQQYTGTGSRTYFEYGFEYVVGSSIIVEVNGIPVDFVEQANGVVIEPAPALGVTVNIFRETPITQERNFTAFDGFHADWTEAALDKLILLKQEAAALRANINLSTYQPYWYTEILNNKGTNALVELWNEGFSGVFSGFVSSQIPLAGSVVERPEDFAYFQYGADAPPPPGPSNVEYFLLHDDQSDVLRYFTVDFDASEVTQLGVFENYNNSVACNNTFTFLGVVSGTSLRQYLWRGTCFSLAYDGNHSGLNGTYCNVFIKDHDPVILVGTEAFTAGMRQVSFETSPPYSYPTEVSTSAANDGWHGCWDIRYTNRGTLEIGDALLNTPANSSNALATYKEDSGNLVAVDSVVAATLGGTSGWSVNRENGYAATVFANQTYFDLYQVESDLTITSIGRCNTTQICLAATVTNDGIVVTCEDTGTGFDKVRTYTRVGTTLTPVDEFIMSGVANSSAQFFMSPRTERIWLITYDPNSGLSAFTIDVSGNITEDINIPNYTAYTGGNQGQVMHFFDEPMITTDNGFTGIKEKLFECWEMEEVGSVTRVGAMGNHDLPVLLGTVTNRAGTIGQAADFDGVSGLGDSTSCPIEMRTVGNFSVCFDTVIDTLSGNQYFFVRGRDDGIITAEGFDLGCYVDGSGNVKFFVVVGGTTYTVTSSTVLSAATKYHIYVQYDQDNDEIGIKVDNGTMDTASITGGINSYIQPFFRMGCNMTTGVGVYQEYLDGYIDQFYWFYDLLTSTEQTFMYNSGNSRAFSEL